MMQALHKLLLCHLLACLGPNALGDEIINGKKVPEKMMLYMASLQDKQHQHLCGGFLISEDFVVSAAHCNRSIPTSVVLGTHNLKKVGGTMRYAVEKTCIHPDYTDVQRGNDIMLLKLSKKAPRNNRVRPIQLPKTVNKTKDNAKCRVAGWGYTKTGGKVVDELQVVDVSFVNKEACQRKWQNKLPLTVICADGSGQNKGFCQGDSGGPLVCSGIAVGVVSFNWEKNCDYPNKPNVYTDVSKYLPWIKRILKQKNCKM
ncbi:mast cell protease 1A-like [Acanthopagrus latus]|uniref:mast cell protease 1A-like n=1 Tax=Acanthopagrus latus TaxID=8177 RepID=UPI00187CE875|nr:mast cell protease 1A-like [Acanthopagrus latus]